MHYSGASGAVVLATYALNSLFVQRFEAILLVHAYALPWRPTYLGTKLLYSKLLCKNVQKRGENGYKDYFDIPLTEIQIATGST